MRKDLEKDLGTLIYAVIVVFTSIPLCALLIKWVDFWAELLMLN